MTTAAAQGHASAFFAPSHPVRRQSRRGWMARRCRSRVPTVTTQALVRVGCSVFLNNRYHDPQLGTFISVDPLIAITGEPYLYASGNATTLSDPEGLAPQTCPDGGCNGRDNRYNGTTVTGTGSGGGGGGGRGDRDDRRERDDERTGGTDRRRDRRRGPLGITDPDSDWMGRAILDHYLTGGGMPMMVINDPDWDAYLRDYGYGALADGYAEPGSLSWSELLDVLDATSLNAVGAANGMATTNNLSIAFPNGEGILGTNYLHGSNIKAGGFVVHSQVVSSSAGDGGTTYTLSNKFIINDVIDPNSIYWTDRVKSTFAEVVTLGGAQGYEISIFTTFETSVTISPTGSIVSRSGWPYG
jgi:RHS repeat-associated protein